MIKKIIVLFGILFTLGLSTNAFELSDSQILLNPFSSPEIQEYSLKVGKKIISNFSMPQTNENLATVVVFKVDHSGNLKSYEITQSSGNDDYDARVIAAVKKSSPYPVPGFQEAEEVGVILNMDLSIIKLVKMLSEGGFDRLDINDLQLEPEVQQPSGKKFVNPYELE
ncbi:TonB C-terminal domain-containing protein [bacterium]|nr:TonB C-terminal domain-containing protein [bacterium]